MPVPPFRNSRRITEEVVSAPYYDVSFPRWDHPVTVRATVFFESSVRWDFTNKPFPT